MSSQVESQDAIGTRSVLDKSHCRMDSQPGRQNGGRRRSARASSVHGDRGKGDWLSTVSRERWIPVQSSTSHTVSSIDSTMGRPAGSAPRWVLPVGSAPRWVRQPRGHRGGPVSSNALALTYSSVQQPPWRLLFCQKHALVDPSTTAELRCRGAPLPPDCVLCSRLRHSGAPTTHASGRALSRGIKASRRRMRSRWTYAVPIHGTILCQSYEWLARLPPSRPLCTTRS